MKFNVKRITGIVFAFVLVMCFAMASAFANTVTTLSGESIEVDIATQTTASAEIYIKDAEGFYNADFKLVADDGITVTSATVGDDVNTNCTVTTTYASTTGIISMEYNGVDLSDTVLEDGVLVTIGLSFDNTIVEGDYIVDIQESNNFTNASFTELTVEYGQIDITVTDSSAAAAEYYTVNFNNITDYTAVEVEVGSEPSDMPTATKDADGDGTTYDFSHWALVDGDGSAIKWTTVEANASITVYPVFTEVAVGETNVDYTITTTLDQEKYRSGDTITATVSASADENTNIAGFQMNLDYDSTLVDLGTITGSTDFNVDSNAGTVWFAPSTGSYVTVNGSVDLFTVTYTVIDGASGTGVAFSVEEAVMTPHGYDNNVGTITCAADTADIIDTVDISFATCKNGLINTTTALTVDYGTELEDITMPSTTPETNYVFSGWAVSGSTDILAANYEFIADTELVAVFVPGSFAISVADDSSTNATVAFETGVVEGKATYNTNVEFTVEAVGDYIISDVVYSVAGSEASAPLTAVGGKYTIPGADITGAVTVTVSAVEYYAITFQAGTGSSLEITTLYAKAGNSGLYESVANLEAGTTTSVPEPTASTGYRLAADTAAEPLWTDGSGATDTSTNIASKTFTADTEYTVNAVKTYDISFVTGDSNKGTVADTYNKTYDTGATVTVPTPDAEDGYEFDGWTSSTSSTLDYAATELTATENATYTANFTEGTYAVTFPDDITGVQFNVTGLTDGKATYNQDDGVTFTITTDDVQINSVKYTVGSGEAQTLTAVNGVYTIPSNEITAEVSITVSATDLFEVKFESENTTCGTVGGTATFNVANGSTLTADNLAKVTATPNTGYQFDGWYISDDAELMTEAQVLAAEVTADVTYTAKFSQIEYVFSADVEDVTIVFDSTYTTDGYATYGNDVTFTISSTTDIITGVKLGEEVLVATNGVYTIDGDDIKGDTAALTLTVSYFDGTITFIDLEDTYMAEVEQAKDRQIMLLETSTATNDSTYNLADGTELSWSSTYEAYVTIVTDAMADEQVVSVGMTHTDTATTSLIDYSGDVNGDNKVNVVDAVIINDILYGTRLATTSDAFLFRADVNGSKVIATDDIVKIKNTVLDITE